MKNVFIALTACIICFGFSHAQAKRTSKNLITKEVAISDFTSVKLMGSPNVVYKQSNGKPHAEIYGPDNVIDLLEVIVEKNVLLVRFKQGTQVRNAGAVEVRVFGPVPEKMEVLGSGDIELDGDIKTSGELSFFVTGSGDISGSDIRCTRLTASVAGSGDINLGQISVDDVQAQVAGSGDIKLSGKSKTADYSVAGSGDIDAAGLKAETVSSKISGSGDILCHAVNFLKGRVSGSGGVAYKGEPEIDFPRKGLRKL